MREGRTQLLGGLKQDLSYVQSHLDTQHCNEAVEQTMNPMDYPFLILGGCLMTLWLSAWIGAWFRSRQDDMDEDNHEDFVFILGGALTLLGLIVGFTFSMAVSRYDQRKDYEEQEANAIGTEYLRVDLLPAADATNLHALLTNYLYQRINGYKSSDERQLRQMNTETTRLQMEMWSAVEAPAVEKPTPVTALVLWGMNDVLNSQGYTQAAWRNRIPAAAWVLLITISIFCNVLIGYAVHGRSGLLFWILPLALSISLFLIADIDSPRYGVIHVHPENLESLFASLPSQ